MTQTLFVSDEELKAFGLRGSDLADRSRALLAQQRETWPLMKTGSGHLAIVQTREVPFGEFSLKLQFNPGRIVSSSAKVDSKSISERKCFLCTAHLPPEQKGLATGDYIILGNPFPIFPEHFTIPHRDHIPQRIDGAMEAMLACSRTMGKHYTLFYNGPKCGASAPDHLHFQAGTYGFMPLDVTTGSMKARFGREIPCEAGIRLTAVDDGLRRFVVMESGERDKMMRYFRFLYDAFAGVAGTGEEEPMLNILASYRNAVWTLIVFLRRQHRPRQYFLEGDNRILFSPASVDFGGVCITPVETDFHRITPELLRDMFAQVSVTAEDFGKVLEDLKNVKL